MDNNIKQLGIGKEPRIFLEKNILEFYDNGGGQELQVVTNLNSWEISDVEYLGESKDWISATKNKSGKFFSLSVPRNEGNLERKANVIIKGTGNAQEVITDTLEISQWEATMLLKIELKEEDGNLKVYLPFKGNVDLTIVWDDSLLEYFNYAREITSSSEYLSFTYPKAGKYNIRIKGTAEFMSTESYEDDQWASFISSKYLKPIKALKQWGNLGIKGLRSAFAFTGVESMVTPPEGLFTNIENGRWMFRGTSLKAIPSDFFYNITGLTTLQGAFLECANFNTIGELMLSECANLINTSYLFAACPKITAIPEKIFEKNILLEDVSFAFSGTNVTNISANILSKNVVLKNVAGLFSECEKLESIPEGLFSNTSNIVNVSYLFSECVKLESIPQGLYSNTPNIENASYFLSGCVKLESIPQGLFSNTPNVLSLERAFANLTSIVSIPSGLFDNLTLMESFQYGFLGCTELTEIPQGLFSNCTSATLFSNVFYGCTSLTKIGSPIFPKSLENIGSGFEGCSSLKLIPTGLFDNLPNAEYLNHVFKDCISLIDIPEGLFAECSACESYRFAFSGCTSLVSIPNRLFNGTNATAAWLAFNNAFAHCTSLKSIPVDLFSTSSKIKGISDIFLGCTGLEEIPEGLFDNCTEITEFKGILYGCTNLKTIPTNIFDNCKKVANFEVSFQNCSSLTCESPYTLVNGDKIHIYERSNENGFVKPWGSYRTFNNASFTDYDNIPDSWKL